MGPVGLAQLNCDGFDGQPSVDHWSYMSYAALTSAEQMTASSRLNGAEGKYMGKLWLGVVMVSLPLRVSGINASRVLRASPFTGPFLAGESRVVNSASSNA